jgi:hypothetical protein
MSPLINVKGRENRMLEHILVPLDRDDTVEAVLAEVRSLVRPGGRVTLLAAAEPLNESPDSHGMPCLADISREIETMARVLHREGLEVDVEVERGELAVLTYAAAITLGVDAVVLADSKSAEAFRLCPDFRNPFKTIISGYPEQYYG